MNNATIVRPSLPRRVHMGRRAQSRIANLLTYFLLGVGMLFTLIPFVWLLSSAFKTPEKIMAFPPQFIPSPITFENFRYIFEKTHFEVFFYNSFTVTAVSLTSQLFFSSLAAYGFARLRFAGRNQLFMVLLGTMMIPFQAYMIPRFMIMRTLGILDTLAAVFLPYLFGGAFYIFLLRQYYLSLPRELDEAAIMDGCNFFQVFWYILLPLTKPALYTIAVLEFLASWNSFLEPLIYLNTQSKFTVALGLSLFRYSFGSRIEWGPLMAATLLVALPCLIVCFAAQKELIGGIATTGIKG
ncbi:carbohydrate ABC transporter membrane protein 2, CUT1 family [Anaerolinea thermolimosa]|nr:carbohydrate ABC transporter membrane protein 2, CUT1 family [Anaerolinea thermolimosa]